jgi:hypothetical protein
LIIGYGSITYHFGDGNLYKKDDAPQQKFIKDLLLFVVKAYMHIYVVENQWLKHLVKCQNPQVVFPSCKQMVQHAIPSLVVKTME